MLISLATGTLAFMPEFQNKTNAYFLILTHSEEILKVSPGERLLRLEKDGKLLDIDGRVVTIYWALRVILFIEASPPQNPGPARKQRKGVWG